MALLTTIIVGAVLILCLSKHKKHYILLSEVIPQGRIISQEEGIIEYKGVQYILGSNDLKEKKHLIESLNLLDLEDSFVIDLRFNKQVIIKTIKSRPRFKKLESGPENLQSRRR